MCVLLQAMVASGVLMEVNVFVSVGCDKVSNEQI